jgi:hypothetical protein
VSESPRGENTLFSTTNDGITAQAHAKDWESYLKLTQNRLKI